MEWTLPHTHCTLAMGPSARHLVFTCPALCKEKLWYYICFMLSIEYGIYIAIDSLIRTNVS